MTWSRIALVALAAFAVGGIAGVASMGPHPCEAPDVVALQRATGATAALALASSRQCHSEIELILDALDELSADSTLASGERDRLRCAVWLVASTQRGRERLPGWLQGKWPTTDCREAMQ